MSIFNGFFDQAFKGLTNPKGNLGDWQHASRLFVDNNFQFAPHSKFLYHVGFFLTPAAQSFTGNIFKPYENVVGMLVKIADLPSFSVNLETKNKYNRKKNIQTNIEYEPISIEFYDDNFGLITALLEAYYRYYYADATTASQAGQGPYGTNRGDTLYKNATANNFSFGLDNRVPPVPFFDKIEITQMQRAGFTTFRLIRPLLASWSHDSVDNSDASTPMVNTINVRYDTVVYERGDVSTGSNGSPTTFGQERYDKVPSSMSQLGDDSQTGLTGSRRNILQGEMAIIISNAVQNSENENLSENNLQTSFSTQPVDNSQTTAQPRSTPTTGSESENTTEEVLRESAAPRFDEFDGAAAGLGITGQTPLANEPTSGVSNDQESDSLSDVDEEEFRLSSAERLLSRFNFDLDEIMTQKVADNLDIDVRSIPSASFSRVRFLGTVLRNSIYLTPQESKEWEQFSEGMTFSEAFSPESTKWLEENVEGAAEVIAKGGNAAGFVSSEFSSQ